jgi:hypothetical protein
MLNSLLKKLNIRLAEIGSSLYQNYKLDYDNKIEKLKFITLIGYESILKKMQTGTIDYLYYSYDRETILETISTQINTTW